MDELVAERDFEQVQVLQDPAAGIFVVLAIHSTRLGPAFGGVRRWAYPDRRSVLEDACRLATAMTWKCAAAGIPGGGGKVVIQDHDGLDRERAYRLLARHVQLMGGRFRTGADVGTGIGELEIMARETGYVTRPGPGGPGDLSSATALGVLAGIEATAERIGFPDLEGVAVLVQGLGDVGRALAASLSRAGSRLLVADLRVDRVAQAVAELGALAVPVAEVLDTPCDILAPCALGGVLDERAIAALRARAVAGAANNVLAAPGCGALLHRRGILYAPDFVINAGGLIHGARFFLEGATPPRERVLEIGSRIGRILDDSRRRDVPSEQVALEIARDRLAAAPEEPYFPPR